MALRPSDAGRNPANGNQPGSWDGLIGPGKAIDTDKLFVVASNMLGSSFGSTNAGSINPQTGEVYGPDFPNITIRDIVAAQKALLDHLNAIRFLVAVCASRKVVLCSALRALGATVLRSRTCSSMEPTARDHAAMQRFRTKAG